MPVYSTVLVTGGAGFIGSHLVDRLLEEDVEVVVLDNLYNGRLENIQRHLGGGSIRLVKGDVRDVALVKDLLRDTDAVLHQAALVSVPKSVKDPILTNDVNVNGTLNLLLTSADCDVKRFVYASSSAVYGDAKTLPISEECPAKPISPYGVSKMAAENYVRLFGEVYGLKTVCLRYFNVYGERQLYSEYSGVITRFIKAIRENLPVIIFGSGRQTRDFVNVHDVVEANLLALTKHAAIGETYNIATGKPITVNHLAQAISDKIGKPLRIEHHKRREGEILHSVADISKARRQLGYIPKITLKKGLEETVAHQTDSGAL